MQGYYLKNPINVYIRFGNLKVDLYKNKSRIPIRRPLPAN